MKPFLFLLMCAWSAICSFAQTENWNDSVRSYISLARVLNADAYLKLADCYHKGLGVGKSFPMMMVMLANADKYGDERVMEEFIKSLPSDDEDRLLYEAMTALDEKRYEEATNLIGKLTSLSPLAGKAMQAVMVFEATKDTVIFHQIITEAIDGGYLMANFVLAARYDVDGKREILLK